LTPVLPLVLYAGFRIDALVAFLIAALYGVAVTRPREIAATLTAAWIRGLEDVAPAVILMMGIGMLLAAAKTPAVQAAVTPVIAALAPRTPIAYVLLFGLLSPLALYRGPLNPFGVGIGVYSVLAALHVLPPVALVAAVMAVVQVQNACDPTNTQNVWVANFTGVAVERITRLVLPYQVGVATLATCCVVVFGRALFGSAPFATAVAAAAGLPLGAGPAANGVVGVAAAPGAEAAAYQVAAAIGRGWKPFRVVRVGPNEVAHDCGAVPYAGLLRVSVEPAGALDDIGLQLFDCAGWSVDQWHVQGPDDRTGALADLDRLRTWMHEHPALATNVFGRGIAYDPADARPTYFFTLFKTNDGIMRALVRPAGPAWIAGLRTGDVVDKVDGKYWWAYGTYQTQIRAYDGKPHTFEVTRGSVHGIKIALGDPYAG
jgi:hypothetical protein